METMNLSAFLTVLGRTSLQAGMLVLVVLLAQWLFRKQLSPRWRCALWLLVVTRLLLPISFSSAASIFNLFPRATPRLAAGSAVPEVKTPQPEPSPLENGVKPLVTPVARTQVAMEDTAAAVEQTTMTPAAIPVAVSPQPASRLHRSGSSQPFPWPLVLFASWLAGVALLAAHIIVTSLRMERRFARSPALEDPAVLCVLEECRNRQRVRTPLRLVESADVTSPALYGLFRPCLLLPMGFAKHFSARELRFVFLHELAHLKRRDLWLNWLIALLQILHWFNPLVWFGFARWRADRELACDALALEAAGDGQNREYGQTILRLLENFTHRAAAPGLVGILEDKRQLHRRLSMIATFKPGKRWGLLSVALLASLAIVCLTDAQTTKSKDDKPSVTPKVTATATNSTAEPVEVRVGIDPSPETTGTNAEIRTLTVTVLDAGTGQPLPGAEVFVPYIGEWNKPRPKRLTDGQGKFVLRFVSVPKEQRRQMSNFGVSAISQDHAQRSIMWTSSAGDVYEGMPQEITLKLENGIPIGGVVQDERGQPLAGVRVLLSGSDYRGFTMGNSERKTHEYSEVSQSDKKSPAAVTDASGRWNFAHFPSDLERVEVTFIRPDEAQESFSTPSDDYFRQRPLISFTELKAQTAVTKLSDGVTVRGMVVDEAGHPLSGVKVKEGYGHGNIVRVSEFTTGADGRFERTHRAPRQWIYTASRADRATASVVAQVEPSMAEVRLVLPLAKPVRLRVVDETDKPIPDAEFRLDTYRTEAQILDWERKTDAEGMAIWTNAPTAPVTLYASSESLGANRKVKIAPGETEERVVLSRVAAEKITVRAKAVNAATRKPVKVQTVSVNYEGGGSPFNRLAEPNAEEFSVEIRRADFRVGMYPSYKLKLDADGYESLTTESMDYDEGNQELELALNISGGVGELTVLQPDGTPAAGARLWARETSDGGSLFINAPGRYYGDRLAKEQAGDDGRIKLPGAPKDAPVVIAHASGFLDTTIEEINRSREVRLKPFGTIEGRLLVAGKPKSGANVMLNTLSWSPSLGFHLSYSAKTGEDGQFTFTQVPPGEFKLYRWMPHSARSGMGRPITETYQMPITVKAGETNRLDYASTGRAVIGQAAADKPEIAVDWLNDDHVLSLKLPGVAATPRPNREDYATFEAFRQANEASFRSAAQLKSASAARTYQLMFETDGSFRVEDVPSGTYELRIRVTKPAEGQRASTLPRPEDELGSLIREVVVPEGKEPFDLGTIVVTMKSDGGVKKSALVDLTVQTLNGKPLKLADYRGRHLLVVFWAAWSERCTEQLAEFKKLRSEYGSGAQLEILGVSVDDDLDSTRKAVDARSYTWSQAWLDAEGRAKATAAFAVDTLPAVFLLDTEGRIVNRDLEGERLRAALRRALQKK